MIQVDIGYALTAVGLIGSLFAWLYTRLRYSIRQSTEQSVSIGRLTEDVKKILNSIKESNKDSAEENKRIYDIMSRQDTALSTVRQDVEEHKESFKELDKFINTGREAIHKFSTFADNFAKFDEKQQTQCEKHQQKIEDHYQNLMKLNEAVNLQGMEQDAMRKDVDKALSGVNAIQELSIIIKTMSEKLTEIYNEIKDGRADKQTTDRQITEMQGEIKNIKEQLPTRRARKVN